MESDDEIMEDNFFLNLKDGKAANLAAIKKWTAAQVKQLLGKEGALRIRDATLKEEDFYRVMAILFSHKAVHC